MEKKNIGDDENRPHRNLNRKLEGKLLLGKPCHGETMAGTNCQQVVLVCVCVEWNHLFQDEVQFKVLFPKPYRN
jgi:hypothetical protein